MSDDDVDELSQKLLYHLPSQAQQQITLFSFSWKQKDFNLSETRSPAGGQKTEKERSSRCSSEVTEALTCSRPSPRCETLQRQPPPPPRPLYASPVVQPRHKSDQRGDVSIRRKWQLLRAEPRLMDKVKLH